MASSTFFALQTSSLLAHWPIDWILIGACAAFIALDAVRSGSARAAALALALPATLLFLDALPHATLPEMVLKQLSTHAGQLIVFAVLFALLYIAIHRMIFGFSGGGEVIQALITGLAATIVLVVVWLQVPALDSLWHFGPQVQAVFAESYRFWWLIVAYAALAFARN